MNDTPTARPIHIPDAPPDDADARHRVGAAMAWIQLGAGEEALRELGPRGNRPGTSAAICDARLWATSMVSGPAGVCEETLDLIAAGTVNRGMLENAAIEASNTGRPRLALRFLDDCLPEEMKFAEAWHTRACAWSQLGNHARALECVSLALPSLEDPVAMLLDAHLAPMWHHFTDHRPGLMEARLLMQPEFSALAERTSAETGLRAVCWHTAHTCLPETLRPHLVRNATLFLQPRAAAPPEVRRRYLSWLDNRRRRMVRVLRKAIRRAREVMLEMQGQWAVEAAARGDWFAVRYHIVLALATRSLRVEDCRSNAGLAGAAWMLDSIYEAELNHPGFCKQTEQIQARTNAGEPNEALDMLGRLPAALQDTPLCKLRAAAAWHSLGRREKAMELWLDVARIWPHEPAAFANLMDTCCDMHQWDLAEGILENLPPSFEHLSDAPFRRHSVQSRQEARLRPRGVLQPFWGQPDLGGLVKLSINPNADCLVIPPDATGD